jgi:hypothetical protein
VAAFRIIRTEVTRKLFIKFISSFDNESQTHGTKRASRLILFLSLSMALQPFEPGRFYSFSILYTVGRTPWTGNQPVGRPLYLHKEQHKHRINAHRHQCLGWNSIPVFERAKTVHALDRAATVIGLAEFLMIKIQSFRRSIQLKNDISAFNRYTC